MCARCALFTSATRGRGDAREVVDLAQVVHAHLDHGVAMVLAQPQQHERHADVVVEVALGGEHVVAPAAVRARIAASISLTVVLPLLPVSATHRQREARAPVPRRAAPSAARVSSTMICGIVARRCPRGARRAPPTAPRPSACGDELVPVEALARERDEEVAAARPRGCRCARPSKRAAPPRRRRPRRARLRRGPSSGRRSGSGRVHRGRASRAASATSASLKGWRSPAISW